MIISHRLKFAFFRVPKTGSTTTELILHMTGEFGDAICSEMPRYGVKGIEGLHAHLTPAEAITGGHLTIEQAREYQMFATLRHPLARAISTHNHAYGRTPINDMERFTNDCLESKNFGLLEKPQTDYFLIDGKMVCEPVDFRDFQNSVRTLVRTISTMEFPLIPNFNVSRGKEPTSNQENWIENNPDPKVKAMLKKKHAADITLWNQYYQV